MGHRDVVLGADGPTTSHTATGPGPALITHGSLERNP